MRDHVLLFFFFASLHWLLLLVGQDTCEVRVGYKVSMTTSIHYAFLLKLVEPR